MPCAEALGSLSAFVRLAPLTTMTGAIIGSIQDGILLFVIVFTSHGCLRFPVILTKW